MNKPLLVYSSSILTQSGYGAKSRAIAKALIKTQGEKYEIQFIPQRWGNCSWFKESEIDPEIVKRLNKTGQLSKQPDVWIMDTISSEFQRVGKYNIGICSGIETTICDVSWCEGNNRMDLVLTSSEHSKNVFLNSKFQKLDKNTNQVIENIVNKVTIEVLSESLDESVFFKYSNKSDGKLTHSLDETISENFAYLFVGHMIHNGRSAMEMLGHDRKNVFQLIKIFLETFKNKKTKPALILKTSGSNPSIQDREEVLKRIDEIRKTVKGDLPNIYLLHGDISDQEMNELYNHPKVKAMVSLTKGEGHGKPLMEYCATQKPIITTGWSGQLDFLKPEYTTLLPGKLTNVHPNACVQGIILPESQWFSVDPIKAAEAMVDVFNNYKNYEVGAKRQAYFCKTNFSQEKMEQRLNDIFTKYVPEPVVYKQIVLPKLNKMQMPQLNKTEI